ncbi:MAG: PAS domain-containing protein, partial [Thermoanaerobacteraceae bacterium]|nr:PAS domain-containing protein [Thermoanaerobacteraceae bacterium]
QQRLLELIFNATPDLLVLKDRHSVYQMINSAFCNFLQKSPEEIIGKTDFDLFPASEAEMYRRDDARIMETKRPQIQEEEVTGAAGKKWLYVAKTPVVDDSGEVIGVLCSVHDISQRKQAEEELNRTLKKLQRTVLQTIEAMARVVEMRDPYTAGHQRRAAELACAIAEELGLPEDRIRGIQMAALIHDIGKIGVPAEILNKPAKLSNPEFDLVKVHPRIGYDILKEIDFPWPIAQMVLQHHERINGSGYPSCLKGEEILLESRILGVADVVEAMASHRPYRPAFSIEEALQEVSRNSGTLYDAGIVDICLRLFKEKGFTFD